MKFQNEVQTLFKSNILTRDPNIWEVLIFLSDRYTVNSHTQAFKEELIRKLTDNPEWAPIIIDMLTYLYVAIGKVDEYDESLRYVIEGTDIFPKEYVELITAGLPPTNTNAYAASKDNPYKKDTVLYGLCIIGIFSYDLVREHMEKQHGK